MPSVQACLTIREYSKGLGELSIGGMIDELQAQASNVRNGDLKRVEATLINQAHSLDAIFNNMARRAALNAGEYLGACDTYLRLTLKAQSQCRATLETLAELKCPKHPTFIRQANIANQQQVNNGANATDTGPPAPARAEEIENTPNELLGANSGERHGTSAAAPATWISEQLSAPKLESSPPARQRPPR